MHLWKIVHRHAPESGVYSLQVHQTGKVLVQLLTTIYFLLSFICVSGNQEWDLQLKAGQTRAQVHHAVRWTAKGMA